MKALIGWLLVLALIAGGVGFEIDARRAATRERDYNEALTLLKQEFTKQTVGLSLLDENAYRREIGVALTRYFSELGRLAKLYPEHVDIERERLVGDQMLKSGQISAAHKQERDERIALTLDLFEKMRSGQYRPVLTAADKTFRFDIYDMKIDKSSGEPGIKLAYVHWGAFGPVEYKGIVGNIRATQEQGKPIEAPQLIGEGQPPSLQIDPERWVAQFVPGAQIGTYDLPLLPQQALGLQLQYDFGIRTVGGTQHLAHLVFPEIPVPDAWKLAPGQPWRAYERFATDEEIKQAGAGGGGAGGGSHGG